MGTTPKNQNKKLKKGKKLNVDSMELSITSSPDGKKKFDYYKRPCSTHPLVTQ